MPLVVGDAVAVSVLAVGVILVAHTHRDATVFKLLLAVDTDHKIDRRGRLWLDVNFGKWHPVLVLKRSSPSRARGLGNHREADGVPDVAFVDEVNREADFGARPTGLVGGRRVDFKAVNRCHGDSEGHGIVGRSTRRGQHAECQFNFFGCQSIRWHTDRDTDRSGFFIAVPRTYRNRRCVKLDGPAGWSDGRGHTKVVLAVALVGDGERGGFVAPGFNV